MFTVHEETNKGLEVGDPGQLLTLVGSCNHVNANRSLFIHELMQIVKLTWLEMREPSLCLCKKHSRLKSMKIC